MEHSLDLNKISFSGVVLQDLTFVHAGNADKLPADRCGGRRGLVNFLKRWHQYAILDSIRKMKRWLVFPGFE